MAVLYAGDGGVSNYRRLHWVFIGVTYKVSYKPIIQHDKDDKDGNVGKRKTIKRCNASNSVTRSAKCGKIRQVKTSTSFLLTWKIAAVTIMMVHEGKPMNSYLR